MDVKTDKATYPIPAPGPTGKTSVIAVEAFVDYKTGDPKAATDWVAFLPAGQVVGGETGLKDKHGNASEWAYTKGADFRRKLSVPCLNKTTNQNYGGQWELVVFAEDGYVERGRSAAFTVAV